MPNLSPIQHLFLPNLIFVNGTETNRHIVEEEENTFHNLTTTRLDLKCNIHNYKNIRRIGNGVHRIYVLHKISSYSGRHHLRSQCLSYIPRCRCLLCLDCFMHGIQAEEPTQPTNRRIYVVLCNIHLTSIIIIIFIAVCTCYDVQTRAQCVREPFVNKRNRSTDQH